MKDKRTVPVQDLGLQALPTPEELFLYCQSRTIEDGEDPVLPHGMPVPTHGEVKVYTPEEVAEYNEAQRDWVAEQAIDTAAREFKELLKELDDD